jgi:hypothetical protein
MTRSRRTALVMIMGLTAALAALGCGNGNGDPPAVEQDNDGPPDEPRSFNSEVPLMVFVVSEDEDGRLKVEEAGTTPSEQPIVIPGGVWWYVQATDDVEIQALATEIKAKGIPGVLLGHHATDADLAHLSILNELRWLGLGAENGGIY